MMMRFNRLSATRFLAIGVIFFSSAVHSQGNDFSWRLENLLDSFEQQPLFSENESGTTIAHLPAARFRLENCQNYPYHENSEDKQGAAILQKDLVEGLREGFQCLSGKGEAGLLHPWHEYQAIKLMRILESEQWKIFRCVKDELFAYAMANTPPAHQLQNERDNDTGSSIHDLAWPGVVLDTFRISGAISGKHDEATYRDFFKLDDEQIRIIRTGKPLNLMGMHRYRNRASLVFHEMVHWLGHEHSGIRPDVTHLYDTCCFGGSEYINDPVMNQRFQQQACAILKDEQLWEASDYRKMRLWRFKGYDQLKGQMRRYEDG